MNKQNIKKIKLLLIVSFNLGIRIEKIPGINHSMQKCLDKTLLLCLLLVFSQLDLKLL